MARSSKPERGNRERGGRSGRSARPGAAATDHGPPIVAEQTGDPVTQVQADAQALAAAMPHNTLKASEYDRHAACDPAVGLHVTPPSPEATASTLSERNDTGKTGGAAAAGADPLRDPLERVRVDGGGQCLRTNQGVPVGDDQHSLKAGLRGPSLLEDFILRDKLTHFDHERIPERVVHARGSGAHGYFESYRSLADLTRAAPFAERGKVTPVFARFSTVAGERGSKDTARDVRGFAVKFYSEDGNWDLVGNNIPVFFIQDAMKFPDLVHALKPEPHHAMPQAASAHDTFWDFVSLMPESTHMLMWLMSDRALPRSFRMMQGFGVHTFRLVNDDGDSHFCKFHWTPRLGTHSLAWDEAVRIAGADPDYHQRDLWEAIEAGEYPEWELGLQVFDEAQAEAMSFDVLDPTKLVPEEIVPVMPVGRMVLNRNPDNFFAETEQVAFCAAHIIPGIDFSNDPLLAGRIHSYVDTQITRLGGPNFHEIPIYAPRAPTHNHQRDGLHRQAIHRGRVAYDPNSLAGGCPFQAGAAGFTSFPQPIHDDKLRGKPEKFAEHYLQARLFYESQSPEEQRHIAAAFRFELGKVTVPAIRARMLASLRNASEALAADVAAGLGMALPEAMPTVLAKPPAPEVVRSRRLSLHAHPGEGGIRARKVAIAVAAGADASQVAAVREHLRALGAMPRLVGPTLGAQAAADGGPVAVDTSFEHEPGVLFDALVLPDGTAAADAATSDARLLEAVRDHYRHCKPILAIGAAQRVLQAAGVPAQGAAADDPALVRVDADALARGLDAFVEALGLHRYWNRETDPPAV